MMISDTHNGAREPIDRGLSDKISKAYSQVVIVHHGLSFLLLDNPTMPLTPYVEQLESVEALLVDLLL